MATFEDLRRVDSAVLAAWCTKVYGNQGIEAGDARTAAALVERWRLVIGHLTPLPQTAAEFELVTAALDSVREEMARFLAGRSDY